MARLEELQPNTSLRGILPDGVPEKTARTVTENARTLKFESQGFEEE